MPKDLSVSALLDFYGPFLSEKQRNLLHHYYEKVYNSNKKEPIQLKKFEKECGLCQNIMSLRSLLDSDKPDAEKLKAAKELLNKF